MFKKIWLFPYGSDQSLHQETCQKPEGTHHGYPAEDLSWPSAAELAKCEEIRKNCAVTGQLSDDKI